MSYDMCEEDVPGLEPRVGDHITHGSNNSCLILGRDRAKNGPASVDDGLGSIDDPGKGKGTGTAHLIAGRHDSSGDPSLKDDSAYLYLSMKTKVDTNLNVNAQGQSQDNDVPAAALKSDHVRVMCRKNVMILMEDSSNFVRLDGDQVVISLGNGSTTVTATKDKIDLHTQNGSYVTVEKGKIVVDGDNVQLGANATERVILGDSFKAVYTAHTHPTGVGPSGPPAQPWIDEQLLSQRKIFVK